jgi:hypothetical protein
VVRRLLDPNRSRNYLYEMRWTGAFVRNPIFAIKVETSVSKFYFNVIAGDGTREDVEGTELPSLDHARDEALRDARALMSDAVLNGEDISSRRLEIFNEEGKLLLTVPFTDAIKSVP